MTSAPSVESPNVRVGIGVHAPVDGDSERGLAATASGGSGLWTSRRRLVALRRPFLWAADARPHILNWGGTSTPPERTASSGFRVRGEPGHWEVNRQGDGPDDRRRSDAVVGLLVDSAGRRFGLAKTAPQGSEVQEVLGALGEDGTAVVAWRSETQRAFGEVHLSVRGPGGGFSPPVTVPGTSVTGADAMDVDVRPDGIIELAYLKLTSEDSSGTRHDVFHLEFRPGERLPAPQSIASTMLLPGEPLVLLAGEPGRGHILTSESPEDSDRPQGQTARLVVLSRTGPAEWTRTTLGGQGVVFERRSVTRLPDGGAALAFADEHGVSVARVAPGMPVARPLRIARVPRLWQVDGPVVTSTGSGELLLVWAETTAGDTDAFGFPCANDCHGRVQAAHATASGAFGPPVVLSKLGTVLEGGAGRLVATIADDGRGLVAWQENHASAYGTDALVATVGAASPERARRPDTTAPRVRVTVSLTDLRAAGHGTRPCRMRVRCSEPCAVRVPVITDESDSAGADRLPVAVLSGRGTRTVRWKLTARERREVRKSSGSAHGCRSSPPTARAISACSREEPPLLPESSRRLRQPSSRRRRPGASGISSRARATRVPVET